MTEENLLSVEELTIAFRSGDEWKNALEKVSFHVRKGKVMGIVGESGSGKTVSSLACMGLLPERISKVVSGSAKFQGTDLLSEDFDWAKKTRGRSISMVFQEPMTSLNPSMRCGKQVAEVISAHSNKTAEQIKELVISLFKEVELPVPEEMWKRYPHELSGGQNNEW